MKKIIVIFGGASPEHDVSIITGMQCAKSLQAKYDVEKIYLSLDNQFYYATQIDNLTAFANKSALNLKPVLFFNGLFKKKVGWHKICDIECVVNCCHGGIGENGRLAGFFESQNIPFTSPNALAAAITMDKNLTKQLVQDIVDTAKGVKIDKYNQNQTVEQIDNGFGEHLIVKPNALGSSIGVKSCTKTDYKQQIQAIFELNDDVLVEEKVEPMVELNQACFKAKNGLILSAIEQPISHKDFLTFDEKYMHGGKSKAKDREIPAQISKKLATKISATTKLIYQRLNLNGVVRIDYMYNTDTQTLYFNEVNTVPGSLAFYLFEPVGIDYITLVENLIANATQPKKYSYFDTKILTKNLL